MITRSDLMGQRVAFHAEATERLAQMKKTGSGIPADEVFGYLRKRVQGESVARPQLRKEK